MDSACKKDSANRLEKRHIFPPFVPLLQKNLIFLILILNQVNLTVYFLFKIQSNSCRQGKKMIGVCGDNCAYCPRYIATKSGSRTELEEVRELWVRLGLRAHDYPAEELACHGCFPGNNCAYKELRACVREKAYENCSSCDDYPCELILNVLEKSEKLKSRASMVCNQKDMEMLRKAFFSKKEFFDQSRRKHHKNE